MKYFCVSDIHGYYDLLIAALDKAGFDRNNPNHTLIACGDHFDRGRQPMEVMKFLMELPRKVLILGNHDSMMKSCCMRGFFYGSDYRNGTVQTIMDLTDEYDRKYKERFGKSPYMADCCREAYRILEPFYHQCVDYYETQKYIFVHAWVPIWIDEMADEAAPCSEKYRPLPDWRLATSTEWKESRWMNPFEMAKYHLQANKTIVCGHWHCSAGWAADQGRSEFGADACFEPYEGNGFVAIDACTAHTGKVNVYVIDDNPL